MGRAAKLARRNYPADAFGNRTARDCIYISWDLISGFARISLSFSLSLSLSLSLAVPEKARAVFIKIPRRKKLRCAYRAAADIDPRRVADDDDDERKERVPSIIFMRASGPILLTSRASGFGNVIASRRLAPHSRMQRREEASEGKESPYLAE